MVGFQQKLDEILFQLDVLFLEKPISAGHFDCFFAS